LTPTDHDLTTVIDAWPSLPDPVKAGIRAMVEAAQIQNLQDCDSTETPCDATTNGGFVANTSETRPIPKHDDNGKVAGSCHLRSTNTRKGA
jgi:hypothetical protein